MLPIALLAALALMPAACGEKEEDTSPVAAEPTETTDAEVGEPNEPDGDRVDDDEPGETESPEDQVELAVETVIGGADPAAACSDLVTAGYIKTAYGDEQGCRAAVAQQKPFEVDVERIEIAGAARLPGPCRRPAPTATRR